jgi:cysteinyl-tRNA synthetase
MIRLHDTMTREKRDFVPAEPDRVTMYVCGPTVYSRAHIGNARPAVVFDLLARLIEHVHPDRALRYARNFTDVDDKIIAAAEQRGVDPAAVTAEFEAHYLADMGALGVRPLALQPRATENIAAMIGLIERLIAGGHAYVAEGHVLFEVATDPDYGALSRRTKEAMQAGARVEVAPYKRDPADFVLWKPSVPEVIGWDSPWGRGRPGWHIECSAMIEAHLGETIDIHAGGLDLIFPHHENEIAQSRCAHGGAPLARYWLHNGFLSMAGSDKMSKSLGNVVTVGELLDRGWHGEVIRLALFSAQYRQPLDWSDALLERSRALLDRWYRAVERIEILGAEVDVAPDGEVVAALADDLNTPLAISHIGRLIDHGFALPDEVVRLPSDTADPVFRMIEASLSGVAAARLMGFLGSDPAAWFQGGGDSAAIETRIAARAAAKARRDFAEADRIRDELRAEGVLLEDSADGTTWRRA